MTREVAVQLLGKSYSFNIPHTFKTEDFLEIVEYVESKYRRIRRETDELDAFHLGLLVAVNIAEEFFSVKKEHHQLRQILMRIDAIIAPAEETGSIPISFSS